MAWLAREREDADEASLAVCVFCDERRARRGRPPTWSYGPASALPRISTATTGGSGASPWMPTGSKQKESMHVGANAAQLPK